MDDPGWNGKEGGLPKERLDDFDDRNGTVTAVSYVGLGAVGGNGHPLGTGADGNGGAHGVSGGPFGAVQVCVSRVYVAGHHDVSHPVGTQRTVETDGGDKTGGGPGIRVEGAVIDAACWILSPSAKGREAGHISAFGEVQFVGEAGGFDTGHWGLVKSQSR